MPEQRADLEGARRSLEFVLQTIQAPTAPPFCMQAFGIVSSALRDIQQLYAPGQNLPGVASQALANIRQAHQILQPFFARHLAWPNVDHALQTAFNALSPIVSRPQTPPGPPPPATPIQAAPMPSRNDWAVGLLVMRHLYDGDAIDWPLPDDHPQRSVFQQLETLGYIARWDRTWPLHDRYRLTEKGIRELEQHYRPADAERIYQQVRQSNAHTPKDRQKVLRSLGVDPWHWSLLHDPYTHWSTWETNPGSYYRHIWHDPHAAGRNRYPRHEASQARPQDMPVRPYEERDLVVPLDEPVGVAVHHGLDDGPIRDLS